MDYKQTYDTSPEWHKKAIIMQLFHSQQKLQNKKWTITETAKHFDVSVGLVSENIRLAGIMDTYPELIKSESRQKALDLVERRKNRRDFITNEDTD